MSDQYRQAVEEEGKHWDSFIAERLLAGEIPGSVDFRLFFTQFAMRLGWQPPCLGPIEINFRRRELRYILDHAVRRRGARVLDLGCGAGWLSLELARRGAHVTAIDVSPANLALGRYAAETNARNFPYLYQRFVDLPCSQGEFGSVAYGYGDLNEVELPRGEYDAVVVWDSLHHVAGLDHLFEQIRHTLKPEGLFIGVDHADIGPRTAAFNAETGLVIEDAYRWIADRDPQWLYEAVAAMARGFDWGLMAVDDGIRPVPGADAFFDQVRREMLDVIRTQFEIDPLTPSTLDFIDTNEKEASPFEDVSAARLMRALLESFQAKRFETICPIVMKRRIISEPRSPQERLFQHYMCALLIAMGERAIARHQTDGQWFVFALRPAQPEPGQADRLLRREPDASQAHITNLTDLVEQLRRQLDLRQTHVSNLEAIIAELKRPRG